MILSRLFVGLFSGLLLTSCAASTIADLKNKPSGVYEFTVNENYQRVYEKISEQGRRCWETMTIALDTDLYSELGEAKVTWRVKGIASASSYYAMAEINKISSILTKVKVYYYFSTWGNLGHVVEKWTNDYKECS